MKTLRKNALSILITVFLSVPITSLVCHALDTDLYVLTNTDIPPNVLVILDNSATMDEVSSGQEYDPTVDYSVYLPSTVYPKDAVYYKSSTNNWIKWRDDYHAIPCAELRDLLGLHGESINYPVTLSTSECGGNKRYDFQTGNFRNFLQLSGGPGGSRSRFGLASAILRSYINTTYGVRFSVMVFNRDSNNNTVKYNKATEAEYVYGDPGDATLDANGGRLLGFVDENKNGKTALFNALSGLKNDT
jgi:hypothetical protein